MSFSHQALFYSGEEEFLAATVPFVGEALERSEPVLVAVTQPRARALQGELGRSEELLQFADMEQLGRNPARIIPAWQRFVDAHATPTSSVRGIGEPIWSSRTPTELGECRRHEALLNLAFADSPYWELLCPYDTSTLDECTLQGACHTHPYLLHHPGDELHDSRDYLPPHTAPHPFAGELPDPEGAAFQMRFDRERLSAVRSIVARQASIAEIPSQRTSDLVLAVNELAANSVGYGGGRGTLRIWRAEQALVCEIRDEGEISDPLAGRHHPTPSQHRGRGLWLANQLCDLLQIRSGAGGTAVRVWMQRF